MEIENYLPKNHDNLMATVKNKYYHRKDNTILFINTSKPPIEIRKIHKPCLHINLSKKWKSKEYIFKVGGIFCRYSWLYNNIRRYTHRSVFINNFDDQYALQANVQNW